MEKGAQIQRKGSQTVNLPSLVSYKYMHVYIFQMACVLWRQDCQDNSGKKCVLHDKYSDASHHSYILPPLAIN